MKTPEKMTRGITFTCTQCEAPFAPWSTTYIPVVGQPMALCADCYAAWKASTQRRAA